MLAMTIKIIDKISSLLNTITGKLATILLFAMMLLTSLDVVGRLLIRPIHGTHELTYLGLAVMVFISLGFTQGAKGHISVDVIVNRFPQRVQAIFDTISYLSALVIVSLMAWQTYEFALRKMKKECFYYHFNCFE